MYTYVYIYIYIVDAVIFIYLSYFNVNIVDDFVYLVKNVKIDIPILYTESMVIRNNNYEYCLYRQEEKEKENINSLLISLFIF